MARTQKFSEDQLLEAVIKFSEIEKKKIKATELAKWCRANFVGLEEVKDYHFTRPIKERDLKSGKLIERTKLCTKKIDEINKARDLTKRVETNILLKASNINEFFKQSDIAQRKMIVETRKVFDELINKNIVITRINEALRAENKSLKENIIKLTEKTTTLEKEQNKLMKQLTYFMKDMDESKGKEMLAKMGLQDKSIDLNIYKKSLQQNLNEVMDINATLKQYIDGQKMVKQEVNLTEDILAGIDF